MALTFDDGPSAGYTKEVLAILRAENVTATFFLEGRWVADNSQLVRAIIDAGHKIGNHGYDHGNNGVLTQMENCEAALIQLEVKTNLFRPALGELSLIESIMIRLRGYRTLLWSFDTHDSMRHEGKWEEGIPDYSSVQGGDIILMHDDNPVCVDELPRLIKAVKSRHLEFVSILEINSR